MRNIATTETIAMIFIILDIQPEIMRRHCLVVVEWMLINSLAHCSLVQVQRCGTKTSPHKSIPLCLQILNIRPGDSQTVTGALTHHIQALTLPVLQAARRTQTSEGRWLQSYQRRFYSWSDSNRCSLPSPAHEHNHLDCKIPGKLII